MWSTVSFDFNQNPTWIAVSGTTEQNIHMFPYNGLPHAIFVVGGSTSQVFSAATFGSWSAVPNAPQLSASAAAVVLDYGHVFAGFTTYEVDTVAPPNTLAGIYKVNPTNTKAYTTV